MNEFLIILSTSLYILYGVSSVILIRKSMKDFPKILFFAWPLFLGFAAFGLFDKE